MSSPTALSGPGPLGSIAGIARHGFLGQTGRMWRRYGDTFRMRMGIASMVLAIHPDAVREVNLTQRRAFDKRASYDGVRRYLVGEGLVASTGELWKRQRKLLAPLFTPKGVQIHAEVMLRDALRTAERWDRLALDGRQVDMGEQMMELTASIIVTTMFGVRADDDIVRLKRAVETVIRFATRRLGPHLPDWLPTRAGREYATARAEVHAFINEIIETRRVRPDPTARDLLSRLMAARDEDGREVSGSLLRDESITMFFAGHETTARTMTATWAALAQHPDAAARLHAELDEVLGDRDPTLDDLHHLPYTLQVVKEVLRLWPAAPFYVRDAVETVEVQGATIEAGTPVMLSPYWTHRHPDFWDDPERFDPERFTRQTEAARHPQAYHPFATGERVCIGNHFSLLESHLLLATLARRFAPRLAPGHRVAWTMAGTLTPVGGMPMLVEQRGVGTPLSRRS